ncbi:phiSA1p31-related protein [Streptomyces pini]|uniref:Uncharacterized protein n=1 Tax=Streptomyces pini TaxID=1520580 RepID=A0A1I4C2C1_9ACTN|nr:phiSA1p31-related protein [Streptomyces pini]SFK74933.1 hypothetical protein SAMN05192584_108220 [Streptomyces pini]
MMHNHCEPQIRVLDLREYPLVATIDRHGRPQVTSTSPCPAVQAQMLRDLADRVEQAGHACCRPQHPADSAPLAAHPPVVEASAPVWRDHNGDPWDLALTWVDSGGSEWWWAGLYDQASGVPLMQSNDALGTCPLDQVHMMWGPMRGERR